MSVPPPVEQLTADCERPAYASDMLVCGDESLMALDAQLKGLLTDGEVRAGLAIESQPDWFKRSRMCAFRPEHYACLRAAYRARIAVLAAAKNFDPARTEWLDLECGENRFEMVNLPRGVFAIRTDRGISLALAATELASWTPFTWVTLSESKVHFAWLNGSTLDCRMG